MACVQLVLIICGSGARVIRRIPIHADVVNVDVSDDAIALAVDYASTHARVIGTPFCTKACRLVLAPLALIDCGTAALTQIDLCLVTLAGDWRDIGRRGSVARCDHGVVEGAIPVRPGVDLTIRREVHQPQNLDSAL
eukprot:scaffold67929_cov55-Phaeocystis_antarctica.AAC.1